MRVRLRVVRLAVILCLLPIEAMSAETVDARTILSRWRTAIHQAKLHCDGAELVRTGDMDGLAAVEQLWITRDGKFRMLVDRQQDNVLVAVSPTGAWYRDWNGHTRRILGEQLERLRTEILEESTLVFGPSDEFESATVRKDKAGDNYVLSLVAEGGQPITWFIDAHTFLPVRSVRPGVDEDLTTEYSRWKKGSGGIRLPFVEQRKESDSPQSLLILQKHRLLTDESIDWGKPDSVPDDPVFRNGGHDVVVPFNFENRHIMVSGQVNGSPAIWFLVDTGAEVSIINEARSSWFGIHPYGKSKTTGGGGATDSRFGFPANFDIAGIELKNQHVVLLDLSGLESVYGMQMGGILGYDFLSRFVTEIDYEKSTLALHDPETWSYTGQGYVVPLEFDNGIPKIDGRIAVRGDSIPARFILDFGASDTVNFTSPFVASHQLLRLASTSDTVNRMAGSEKQFFSQTNIRGKIDALTLGNISLTDVPVNLSIAQKGAYASTRFAAAVGETIFSRFPAILDYPNQRLILEPTAVLRQPFPGRRTYGLTILASGDDLRRFTVTGVRAGSPAEKQGFRAGDMIREVNGASSSSYTLGALRSLLNEEGRAIAIRVSRGSGTEILPVVVSLVPTDAY